MITFHWHTYTYTLTHMTLSTIRIFFSYFPQYFIALYPIKTCSPLTVWCAVLSYYYHRGIDPIVTGSWPPQFLTLCYSLPIHFEGEMKNEKCLSAYTLSKSSVPNSENFHFLPFLDRKSVKEVCSDDGDSFSRLIIIFPF